MNNLILFDDDCWQSLLPFTFTRPTCELRVGILTIREKWEKILESTASYITQDYLSEKYPITIGDDNILINAGILPNTLLVEKIKKLLINEGLYYNNDLIAARLDRQHLDDYKKRNQMKDLNIQTLSIKEIQKIEYPEQIYQYNGDEIRADFALLTAGRKSQPLAKSINCTNPENIFLEEGAVIESAILNATEGPIYIGKAVKIMDGSIIRGNTAFCEESVVKIGSRIYPNTTIGPHCKVAGEIKESVIFGYSNKAHEGFLGNSVIGEWCNLGADTNTSNLKNNYSEVRIWDYTMERFRSTGSQFCGLMMGDHSKCGINTMFNTGTVVGVCANIFGAGYPRVFIPSFSWGGASGFSSNKLSNALEVNNLVMERRNQRLTDMDKHILTYVNHYTRKYRSWEKS